MAHKPSATSSNAGAPGASRPGSDGAVAVVTGASSGIGRAVAVRLAAGGLPVLGVGRDRIRLSRLAAEASIETLALSLESPGACQQAFDAAARLGSPLVLVHAAGLGGYLDKPIFDQSSEAWRATMAVNLDAAFELSRRVARTIREAGWGRIVLIGSTAGGIGAPAMSAYSASKHGLLGLMRSVAHDLAPVGGTCNAVLPSWVRTEMAERDAEAEAARRGLTAGQVWDERAAANPSGRLVEAEEVAEVVAFLASDAARAVNGEAVTVSLGSPW